NHCIPPRLRFLQDGSGRGDRVVAVSLQREEEEQLILNDRTADSKPELIEVQTSPGNARLVRKEVIGIQRVVADVFPAAAVPGIGAALGDKIDGAAGAVAVLRGHVQLQLLEFLDRILDRHVDRTAAQALIGDAVDQEAVEVFTKAVDDRAVAVFEVNAVHVHGAGAHLHQVKYVAPVERQVVDLRGTHRGRQLGIFGIDDGSFAGDLDDFRSLANLQLEV